MALRSDYDHTQLQKLEARNLALQQKRRELEDIVRNHELLQREIAQQRSHENEFRHELGAEYLQLGEEKRRRAEEERRAESDPVGAANPQGDRG